MTREEQIEQQTFVYYESCSDEDIAKSKGFIDGAKWADKTMVDKACAWLEDNLASFWRCKFYNDIEFIKDFKQAMDEQQ